MPKDKLNSASKSVTENDFITKLVEKPTEPVSKLALVGLYYLKNSKSLADALNELVEKDIRTKNELQLTDALQIMIERGEKISTFPVEGWYDCGKPETLLSTNQFLLSQNGKAIPIENVVINEPVFIANTAKISNSVIGPYATISEGCEIKDSIIKNSIINENGIVHKTMLDNSIVGSNAIIKGNFKKLNAGDSSEIEFY